MYLSFCFICFIFFFFLSMFFFYSGIYFVFKNMVYIIEYEIMTLNSTNIFMVILLDWMSLIFTSFVLFISSMVIFYSYNYMFNDLNMNRFILMILLFVLSMILLIISPNLISILLGWDGLGLVSYCLVIYYQNMKSYNSGMLTVLSNRIGDLFFLMSIAWMLNYGSWSLIYYLDFMNENIEMKIISLMIFIASITKSAQIPFSSWLPAAMAAPTPVSSLVHSSTLVTAGVYLIIRFNSLFINSNILNMILMISGITMFMAGICANFEYDLKKIIALSTLSQLGLMFMVISLGFNTYSFFHLMTHAMFKSLLFLCSGLMIHNLYNIQDIRFMGSLSIQLPMTSICFNFSNLSLCGFPFLSGFYSKDLILEIYLMKINFNLIIYFLLFFSTMLTISYTFRLIFFTMLGSYNMTSLNFLGSESWIMLFSMYNLMIMTLLSGSILMWLIFPFPFVIYLPLYFKLIPFVLIFLGVFMGYLFFKFDLMILDIKFYYLMSLFSLMWFLPILSTNKIIKYPLFMGEFFNIKVDLNWLEFLGGQGLMSMIFKISKFIEWYNFSNLNKILVMILYIYSFLILIYLFM